MNRLRFLLSLFIALSLQAQGSVELKAVGGGELKIGATTYLFTLADLSMAPPKGGLPGAVKLTGTLASRDGSPGFRMDLTVLKNGTLYMLVIQRRMGQAYPDSWNATPKTRVRILKMEDRLGGRVEIRCDGPLTGVLAQKPVQASWTGSLWATFPGGPPSEEGDRAKH